MSKEKYYNIIISPSITEKGTMVSASNTIVFNVAPNATKPEIKAAIEGLFNVKVKAVNTLVRKGKLRAFKGRRVLLSDKKHT
jgi:large subunit ribosomal protein L23